MEVVDVFGPVEADGPDDEEFAAMASCCVLSITAGGGRLTKSLGLTVSITVTFWFARLG